MGPYSHFALAAKLEPAIQPEDRGAYFWGAVAPDVRYLANMRRMQTHLDPARLDEFAIEYPHLRSFLSGYRVHLLIDQFEPEELARLVGTAFPMNLLNRLRRRGIKPEQMTMLIELYYLQCTPAGGTLSGGHNEVLESLGVTAEQSAGFQQALREYFSDRSYDAALAAFQKIGVIQNSRVERYQDAFRKMQKRKLVTAMFLLSIKNAHLDERVSQHVQAHWN